MHAANGARLLPDSSSRFTRSRESSARDFGMPFARSSRPSLPPYLQLFGETHGWFITSRSALAQRRCITSRAISTASRSPTQRCVRLMTNGWSSGFDVLRIVRGEPVHLRPRSSCADSSSTSCPGASSRSATSGCIIPDAANIFLCFAPRFVCR